MKTTCLFTALLIGTQRLFADGQNRNRGMPHPVNANTHNDRDQARREQPKT